MHEKEIVLIFLNIFIFFMQLILKAEIKRLDEKIEIFVKRLEKIENRIFFEDNAT